MRCEQNELRSQRSLNDQIPGIFDANVIVSGIVGYGIDSSTPGKLIRLMLLKERFEVVVSDYLLIEVSRTLAKPYFVSRIDPVSRFLVTEWLENEARHSNPDGDVGHVATHPEDDLILAAAVFGGCEFLVTGDAMLLRIERYGGLVIVSPAAFLAMIESIS